jgi:hypothetical protein
MTDEEGRTEDTIIVTLKRGIRGKRKTDQHFEFKKLNNKQGCSHRRTDRKRARILVRGTTESIDTIWISIERAFLEQGRERGTHSGKISNDFSSSTIGFQPSSTTIRLASSELMTEGDLCEKKVSKRASQSKGEDTYDQSIP